MFFTTGFTVALHSCLPRTRETRKTGAHLVSRFSRFSCLIHRDVLHHGIHCRAAFLSTKNKRNERNGSTLCLSFLPFLLFDSPGRSSPRDSLSRCIPVYQEQEKREKREHTLSLVSPVSPV